MQVYGISFIVMAHVPNTYYDRHWKQDEQTQSLLSQS